MGSIEPVSEDIWRWEVPSADPDQPDLVGHVVRTADGWVVFDPPAAPGVVSALRALGSVSGILLTGGHHDRAAGALRARVGMPPIAAPARDVAGLVAAGVLVDQALAEGDRIFGFDVIDLPTVQNFGAECAFFDPRRRLLVVSDLVVAGAHGLMHYGEAFHADVTAVSLRAHLKRLMELEPTILLAGHGQDLTEDSARQLAELYRRG